MPFAKGLEDKRLILVTGKGGVGKTTVAAALALCLAKRGQRVLCAEIAPDLAAPSALAEALGAPLLTEEPSAVRDNLQAVLLTPTMGHRRFLQDALPIKLLADTAMRSSAIRKFLNAAPGFADMGVMYRMLDLLRQKRPDGQPQYEVCVVDSPATGHALALAQIPAFLLQVIPGGPIGRAAREGLEVLTDRTRCAALVVSLPETLPITEARELVAGLLAKKVPVTTLVLNRVPVDPFSVAERDELTRLLAEKGPVVGARELRRVDRAIAALALAARDPPAQVEIVPELAARGAELAHRLSAHL